jgi:pseudouridine kinase
MKDYVTIIGAANMDINGFSTDPINMADSNPGRVEYCMGGVGRNIAENLARLGTNVELVSVIGDDPAGNMIKTGCPKLGISVKHSVFLDAAASSVYLALMDSNGEMKVALSDMSILEKLSPSDLENRADLIEGSSIIVVDAGLSEEVLRFIPERFAKPVFLDPVSARKSAKLKSFAGKFDTLKLSRMEAEFLSGIPIPVSPAQTNTGAAGPPRELLSALEKAGGYFIDKGVRRVFITLGKGGIYFCSGERRFFTPVTYVEPVNTSGGGDSFMAGIVYGTLHGFSDEEIVSFSAAMAAITVQSKTTVSTELNLEAVKKRMEDT